MKCFNSLYSGQKEQDSIERRQHMEGNEGKNQEILEKTFLNIKDEEQFWEERLDYIKRKDRTQEDKL